MKVNLLKLRDRDLRIEVQGEGHTLLNLLQKILLENRDVEIAGYTIPHRLTDSAILQLKMVGKARPVRAVLEATRELNEMADVFQKALRSALEEYEKPKARTSKGNP